MNIKEHMNILLNEKRRLDAQVEADLRRYAELCAEKEARQTAYDRSRKETIILRDFFLNFAQEAEAAQDSNHLRESKQESVMRYDQLEEIKTRIQQKEEYYKALKEEDYDKLVWLDTEEGSFAAVKVMYNENRAGSLEKRKSEMEFLERYFKQSYGERLLQYCFINHLIYCDQHDLNNLASKAEMERYGIWMKQFRKTSDSIWTSIDAVYQSYEVQEVLQRCVNCITEYRKLTSSGESMLQSFDRTCTLIEDNMKKLFPKLKGVKDFFRSESMKRWYRKEFRRMNRQIRQWKSQNKPFHKNFKQLKEMESALRTGMQEGLEKKEMEQLSAALTRLEEEMKSFFGAGKLKTSVSTMRDCFTEKAEELTKKRNAAQAGRRR